MALLEVRDLRAGYGFPVLHGISFEVDEGETAVLLGLNGAGKTTTVSAVAGLVRPESGSVRLDGREVAGRGPAELVALGVALVPEGRRVFPSLTVDDHLRVGAWTRRRDAALVARQRDLVLAHFPRLGERAGQRAGTLSGGEQQMLAVARALMSRPRLLLVDEASLGLSPALARTMFQVVDRVRREGTTVVLVEQNAGVLPYADRAFVLEQGTVVHAGAGAEIRRADLRGVYLGGGRAGAGSSG